MSNSIYLIAIFAFFNVSSVFSIAIDNGVEGDPEIECGPNTITVTFNTRNNFEGHVFVKGRYNEGGCKSDQSGKKTASISLPFSTCGVERQRTLNPRGIFIGVPVVITFHPQFLTKVDRAYSVQCFYMEADKTVSQDLEVSEITTAFQTQVVPMPVCRYEILDGGPNGEPIKSAIIGQQVYHKWICDTETIDIFCMVVHSCYVDDGSANKVQLLDEHGCALDKFLLSNLEYISDLMAGKESPVFKFADKPALFFQCQISVAIKEPEEQCPRPQCPETGGLLGPEGSESGATSKPSQTARQSGPPRTPPLGLSGTSPKPSTRTRSSPGVTPPVGGATFPLPPAPAPTPPSSLALAVIAGTGRTLPAPAPLLSLERTTRRPGSNSATSPRQTSPRSSPRATTATKTPTAGTPTTTRQSTRPPTTSKGTSPPAPTVGSTSPRTSPSTRSTTQSSTTATTPSPSTPPAQPTPGPTPPGGAALAPGSLDVASPGFTIPGQSPARPPAIAAAPAAASPSSILSNGDNIRSTETTSSTSSSSSSTSSSTSTTTSTTSASSTSSSPSSTSSTTTSTTSSSSSSPTTNVRLQQNSVPPRSQDNGAPRFDFESTFPFRIRRVRSSSSDRIDYAGTWDVRAPPLAAYENFDNTLNVNDFRELSSKRNRSPFGLDSSPDLYCVPTLFAGLTAALTLLSVLASTLVALFVCLRRPRGKCEIVE